MGKRLMNDSHAKRKRRSLTQLTSDIDAYIALWGSQQAVTKQQFLDNLAFTCNTCHGLRDLELDCSGKTTDCSCTVTTYADLISVAAPGSSSGGGSPSGGSSGGGGSGGNPGGK